LFAAMALSDHMYKTERALLFKIAAEKENCTYNDIREISYAHVERTADVRRVEVITNAPLRSMLYKNHPKPKTKIRNSSVASSR